MQSQSQADNLSADDAPWRIQEATLSVPQFERRYLAVTVSSAWGRRVARDGGGKGLRGADGGRMRRIVGVEPYPVRAGYMAIGWRADKLETGN